MNVFYKPNIDGNLITLDPSESLHCIKVLRSSIGDRITIIDGNGGHYTGEIVNDHYKACEVSILSSEQKYNPLPYDLEIAIAPTKNIDRFEWFLEKATEIGVSVITPILCERSERRNIRIDRLEKILIAAMKQSAKSYLPKLNPLIKYNDWLMKDHEGSKYIAHCIDGPKENLWKAKIDKKVSILIGPEGDFSSLEVAEADQAGFLPVSLGSYRLRSETAGVVACSAVYFNLEK